MKAIPILFLFLFFFVYNSEAQIDIEDRSVQVVGYWEKNEKHTYTFIYEKYRISESDNASDTLRHYKHQYSIDIEIIDSTENSYIINWKYYNFKILSADKNVEFFDSLFGAFWSFMNDLNVIVKTDELGTLLVIMNSGEIQQKAIEVFDRIKKEVSKERIFSFSWSDFEQELRSDEMIETIGFEHIYLFYWFFGTKLVLGDNHYFEIELPNPYADEPFDGLISFWLEDIFPEDGLYQVKLYQEVDAEKAMKMVYDKMVKLSNKFGKNNKVEIPSLESLPRITNETFTTSLIHESGWPFYIISSKEVKSMNTKDIEHISIYFGDFEDSEED